MNHLVRISRRPVFHGSIAWTGAVAAALLFAASSLAVPGVSAAQSLPPMLNLPAVPSFQLSLPAPSTSWIWVQQEGSPVLAYWQTTVVSREWRDVPDDELRLELETGRLELGRLVISGQISTAPGRERDCAPSCRGGGWSSALRLKYTTGDLGPLRQTGPDLSLGWTPARPGLKSRGLLRGGFSGKF
jgi:hypothetical protein